MRAIAAGCLAFGLLVSACSAGGGQQSAETPGAAGSPSSTARPTATATATPRSRPTSVPAPPPVTDDRPGRAAFARYVLEAWIYALNNNDPRPMLEVSGRDGCAGCAQLARELEKRDEQGWYVVLQGVRVSSTKVTGEGPAYRAVMSVDIPESATYHDDGSFRALSPAHPGRTFEVEMTLVGKRFRLESFSLY